VLQKMDRGRTTEPLLLILQNERKTIDPIAAGIDLDHRPGSGRALAFVISLRLSPGFTSINRLRGSIPARAGFLGTVTVMRCSPERTMEELREG